METIWHVLLLHLLPQSLCPPSILERCLSFLGLPLAPKSSVGPYLLFQNDVLSGVLPFLGIWKLCSSLLGSFPSAFKAAWSIASKEWSSVLFLPNFLNMWVPPTDWASSLFHSKCPAIWLLLSLNSEDPLSKFTVNLLIAKHKGSFSDFVSFVLSATLECSNNWSYLSWLKISFLYDYLFYWLFECYLAFPMCFSLLTS